MRNEKGFTLIELLIVVAIIGIIAAIAIPSLLNALDRGRQSATTATIKTIGDSINVYIMDFNNVGSPKSADIAALAVDLGGAGFIQDVEALVRDGWGNDMIYEAEAAQASRGFTITSYGSNAVAGPDPVNGAGTPVKKFSEDIIFVDNHFYQAPEGNQQQ